MNAPLPPGPPPRATHTAAASQWSSFIDRIDVRSPAEYAEDHVPGAVNLPVLDDAERTLVGTMYVQQSAFDARKVGAALVANNIARICEAHVRDKPREWAPLVYCWRGGQRSRALVHVLCEIGFRAVQLDGGYRAYRRHVVAALAELPRQFRFRVVCGLTGSGKSRLIEAIAAEGGQVLDLERLARHRGSLLGELPGDAQPSQKMFESGLLAALGALDPARPVFVESESRRIGMLQVNDALLDAMRASPCVRVDTARPLRIRMLVDDYSHWSTNAGRFDTRLAALAQLHGKSVVTRWRQWARDGSAAELAGELLDVHYDPLYERAIRRNFASYDRAIVIRVDDCAPVALRRLARDLLARVGAEDGRDPTNVREATG